MSHADLLKRLLPPSSLDAQGAAIGGELVAEGAVLDEVLALAVAILAEDDPRTASQMLADWERVLGLPDECVVASGAVQTADQRRAAAAAKLATVGGQSRQYFIDLAAALGYPGATIDEYRPFNCNSNCNDALWSEADRFAWQINLPSDGGTFLFNCNSPCDAPLAAWGDEAVECRIQRLKPAHTTAIVAYV